MSYLEPIEAVPEKSVLPTENGVLNQNDLLKDNSVSEKEPNEEIVNEISSSKNQGTAFQVTRMTQFKFFVFCF